MTPANDKLRNNSVKHTRKKKSALLLPLMHKGSVPNEFILKAANIGMWQIIYGEKPWVIQLCYKSTGQPPSCPNASDNFIQVQLIELLHS